VNKEKPNRLDAVSVIVPARNEGASIAAMLDELLGVLEVVATERAMTWEVIVVDDGSTDDTLEVASTFVDRGVRTVRHLVSRGYGAALKSGMKASFYPWVLIIDADGTYPPSYIPELLAACSADTMAVGSRVGKNTHVPAIRKPAKWLLTRLASHFAGVEIADLNSGLRVFPKYLATGFNRILPDGFSFTSTITLAALSSGWTVRYVPIDYRKRGGRSKIRPFRDTIGFLMLIVRTVIYFDPLRVFLPLGLFFLLASPIVAGASLALTGRLMDVTTVVLLVTGIQLLALGIIADAINRRLS
jgi:glycosyltransferase involved in cell wall biosynthesis